MKNNRGQALITLLIFMVVGTIILSAATVITLVNTQAATRVQNGTDAYYVAESGAENAMLRLLRDPNYSGETLTVGIGAAVVTVTGSASKTITSQGTSGNFVRTIQVVTGYTNNVLTVTSWKEI